MLGISSLVDLIQSPAGHVGVVPAPRSGSLGGPRVKNLINRKNPGSELDY